MIENAAGRPAAVIGAHYAGLEPVNAVRVSTAESRATAARTLGAAGDTSSTLKLHPRDGRLYYEVETQRVAHRWIQWIDATTGNVGNTYDAVAHGEGVGVKGDTKDIDTTRLGDSWRLISADRRQETYDAQNRTTHPGVLMTDPDNVWDLTQPATLSPSQPAGVDAH